MNTRIPTFNDYPWMPAELEAERQSIESAFDDIAEQRAEIERTTAAVKTVSVDELDFAAVKAVEKAREKSFKCLQSELQLRTGRLKPYYQKFRDAARDEYRRLIDERSVIESEICQALEGIGYERPGTPPEMGQYTAQMVNRHPRYCENCNAAEGVNKLANNHGPLTDNDEAVKSLRERLESFRRFVAV